MMRLNRVFLIRHGQIQGWERSPVYGHTDVALSEMGQRQMERMADRLRLEELHAIYSSDLGRSIQGAKAIALFHNTPHHSLAELREMDFGPWEGLTLSEIMDQYPGELLRRQADILNYQIPGGGETLQSFSERILRAFHSILTAEKGYDFAIVAHAGVNRIILCHALGLDLQHMFSIHQDYGCLNIIDFFPDAALVRLVNG